MITIATIMRRVIRPPGPIPATLIRNKAASILTTTRGTLVGVDVVEVTEKGYNAAADRVEVVSRRSRVVVVALPVKVCVGGVGVLGFC